MKRIVAISVGVFAVIALSLALVFGMRQWVPGTPHELGQQVLKAAEDKQWDWAKVLLENGADPDVTELDPKQVVPKRTWRDWTYNNWPWWLGRRPLFLAPTISTSYWGTFRFGLKRSPALQQAITQKNLDAVKLMLKYRAKLGDDEIRVSRESGSREIINLIENAAHLPIEERSICHAPFARGGETAKIQLIPNSDGSFRMRHMLWLSPDKLLVARTGPPRLYSLDIRSGIQTELNDLTRKWSGEDLFDPNTLALSPDSKWLLGCGGTGDYTTWLSTEINGDGVQQWDRKHKARPPYMGDKLPIVTDDLPVAWRDTTRWIEINCIAGNQYAVHEHSLGQTEVREWPLDKTYDNLFKNPMVVFTFSDPDHAAMRGEAVGPVEGKFVGFMEDFIAGPQAWHAINNDVRLPKDSANGSLGRCMPSPNGKRLAWFDYFKDSGATDILLSDADGKNMRIVYEKILPREQWGEGGADVPWGMMLEWLPKGEGLIFRCGIGGEKGLGILPIAADE